MTEAETEYLFPVPIEKAFQVITDYNAYGDYVPGVDQTEVIERQEGEAQVVFSLNVIKKFRYQLTMKEVAPTKVSWSFHSGDFFKTNSGSWDLTDLGDGRTKAIYKVHVDFKIKVPKLVLKKLVSRNLPELMEAYEKRMLELS